MTPVKQRTDFKVSSGDTAIFVCAGERCEVIVDHEQNLISSTSGEGRKSKYYQINVMTNGSIFICGINRIQYEAQWERHHKTFSCECSTRFTITTILNSTSTVRASLLHNKSIKIPSKDTHKGKQECCDSTLRS